MQSDSLHLNRPTTPGLAMPAAIAQFRDPVPGAIPTCEYYRLVMGQFEDNEAELEEYYQ